jgi:hypothetical protein
MGESEDSEKIDLSRYQREMVENLKKTVNEYVRIMEWDVPDIDDEKQARGLVMEALKSALAEVEATQENES